MKCRECKQQCRCVDSRDRLIYGLPEPEGPNKPVKERKYICISCSAVHYTREFVESVHKHIPTNDKRVLERRRQNGTNETNVRGQE